MGFERLYDGVTHVGPAHLCSRVPATHPLQAIALPLVRSDHPAHPPPPPPQVARQVDHPGTWQSQSPLAGSTRPGMLLVQHSLLPTLRATSLTTASGSDENQDGKQRIPKRAGPAWIPCCFKFCALASNTSCNPSTILGV